MEPDKYADGAKRFDELMGIYRQLKRLAFALKEMEVRSWKSVEAASAKLLRQARKEKKLLGKKRVKK